MFLISLPKNTKTREAFVFAKVAVYIKSVKILFVNSINPIQMVSCSEKFIESLVILLAFHIPFTCIFAKIKRISTQVNKHKSTCIVSFLPFMSMENIWV